MSRVIVSSLPERLPWREGTLDQVNDGEADYYVIAGDPDYGMPTRLRDNTGESFEAFAAPGTGGLVPQPNNPGNPHFGKKPLPTKDFFGLAGQVLGTRYARLRNDAAFLWVYDVLTKVETVDVDDRAGQFLQILTYLTNTNAADGKSLLSANDVTAIMAGWH